MSARRLVAALLTLQTRGRVTARELADELEVSEKTARRDLEALAMAGFPVYSQPGRGGGWQLLGGARTDLTGLTADEVRALFLVAGTSTTVTPETRTALRKLVRALPESFRATAEAAATAVVVDRSAWGSTAPSATPDFLRDLERAVIERRQVELGYSDRTQTVTERTVHPLGLVSKGDVWYLLADTDAGMRTFRVSRVRSAHVTNRRAERPEGFDLTEAWTTVVANVSSLRTRSRATIRLPAELVWPLRGQFGSDMSLTEHEGADPSGHVEVIVGGPSPLMIARHLAGWGGTIDVLDPPEVRDELLRIADGIRSRYRASRTVTGSGPSE